MKNIASVLFAVMVAVTMAGSPVMASPSYDGTNQTNETDRTDTSYGPAAGSGDLTTQDNWIPENWLPDVPDVDIPDAAEQAKELLIDEIYPNPPAPGDPGFATVVNILETFWDYDTDGDGEIMAEEADDPWECGELDCSDWEDEPGWDGPTGIADEDAPTCGDGFVCA